MRAIIFTKDAFEQYNEWVSENKKIHERLKKLIEETLRTPFDGTGKPESLKGDLKGCWSRRIDDTHRV